MKTPYIAQQWSNTLKHNQLDSFERFWAINLTWFEPPNYRRGGWSGVGRMSLQDESGHDLNVFVKKQKNHAFTSLRSGLRKRPTLEREFINIVRYQKLGIPTLEPLFYDFQTEDGRIKAILVTKALDGYISFDTLLERWAEPQVKAIQRILLQKIAVALRNLHALNLKHNCFYPKHVLLRFPDDDLEKVKNLSDVKLRIIDLEKMRRTVFRKSAAVRDLASFYKRGGFYKDVSIKDVVRFLLYYFDAPKLTPEIKDYFYLVLKRINKKRKSKS